MRDNTRTDWLTVASWAAVIVFALVVWAAIIIALWTSAGCSTATPC